MPVEYRLDVEYVRVRFEDLPADLDYWYTILSVCDPEGAFFTRVKKNNTVTIPASVVVSPWACDFAQRWDGLRQAYFYGADSVPVAEGVPSALALRAGARRRPASYEVFKTLVDGETASSDVTLLGLEPVMAKFTSMVPQPEDDWIGVCVEWEEDK